MIAIDTRLNKLYVKELYYETGVSSFGTYEKCKSLIERRNDLIIADPAGKKTILTMIEKGLNVVGASKKHNSIEDGVKLIESYEIIITSESKNVANELNNYKRLNGKIVDDFNHAIDALRYAVSYQLQNPTLGEYHIY